MLGFNGYSQELQRRADMTLGDPEQLDAVEQRLRQAAADVDPMPDALTMIGRHQRESGLRGGLTADGFQSQIQRQARGAEVQVVPLKNAATAFEAARLAFIEAANDQATIRTWFDTARTAVENAYLADKYRVLTWVVHAHNSATVTDAALIEANRVHSELEQQLIAAAALFTTAREVSAEEVHGQSPHSDHGATLGEVSYQQGPEADRDEDISSMPAEPGSSQLPASYVPTQQDRLYPWLFDEDGNQPAYEEIPEDSVAIVPEGDKQGWRLAPGDSVETDRDGNPVSYRLQYPFSVLVGRPEGVSPRRAAAYVAEVEVAAKGLNSVHGEFPTNVVYDSQSAPLTDFGKRALTEDGGVTQYPIPDTSNGEQTGVAPHITIRQLDKDINDFAITETQNARLSGVASGGVTDVRYRYEDGQVAVNYTVGLGVHENRQATQHGVGTNIGGEGTLPGVGRITGGVETHREVYENIPGNSPSTQLFDLPPLTTSDVRAAADEIERQGAELDRQYGTPDDPRP